MAGTKRTRPSRWESLAAFERRMKRRNKKRYYGGTGTRMSTWPAPSIGRGPLLRAQKVTLRYQGSAALDPIAGVTAVHIWAANGVYDPDITGVGHQPRGFDQIMALYDHYVVIGAKITVDFVHDSGNPAATGYGIALRDTSSTDNINGYIEGGNVVYQYRDAEGGVPTRLTMTCNPNKFLGRNSPMSDPDLKGGASNNPAELAFFHTFYTNAISAENPSQICACTLLEYTCIFIEPKVPAQS